jgi:hypothetical protein
MSPTSIGRSTAKTTKTTTKTAMLVASTLLLFLSASTTVDRDGNGRGGGRALLVSASAVAPRSRHGRRERERSGVISHAAAVAPTTSREPTSSSSSLVGGAPSSAGTTASFAPGAAEDDGDGGGGGGGATAASPGEGSAPPPPSSSSSSSSSNPLLQLAAYVRDTAVNFRNGLGEMNASHRRCNAIRDRQRAHAREVLGATRPRGAGGVQGGGISYEEYDFLRRGLVDRSKLLAAVAVSLFLPNYFVYYLWSFPDMMPGPFAKGRGDPAEVSRRRCHAVISAVLDVERGARVAPWSSKINPFGRGAAERAASRLGGAVASGCRLMAEAGMRGPGGGGELLRRLGPDLLYSTGPVTGRQRRLAGSDLLPGAVLRGLARAINADPLNRGAAPFGIGAVRHIESVALADEFLVDNGIDVTDANDVCPRLVEEACSARLIGNPGWTDGERRGALASWLREVEIAPRGVISAAAAAAAAGGDGGDGDGGEGDAGRRPERRQQRLYYNGNMARAVLMCYNAVDGTRDERSDSRLLRVMYQGGKE